MSAAIAKRHVVALIRDIDGPVALTFCGRIAGADCDTPDRVIEKVRKDLFRTELHCRLCLRALELNELLYVHVLDPELAEVGA